MTDSTSQRQVDTSILEALQGSGSKEIIALLFRFGLAQDFFKCLKEREIVFKTGGLSKPEDIHEAALLKFRRNQKIESQEAEKQWCRLRGLSKEDLLSEAIHAHRLEEFCSHLVGSNRESLYLRYKDKLDRVLYSLIRTTDTALSRHLYYAINAGEISFGKAARIHSAGLEAKTEGIVGPVDLTVPHPEISSRLKLLIPGEISEPFIADGWQTIVRLEYRYENEYDEDTSRFLGDLCLRSYLEKSLNIETAAILDWVISA